MKSDTLHCVVQTGYIIHTQTSFLDYTTVPQTWAHLITGLGLTSCTFPPFISSKTYQVLLEEPGMHGLGPTTPGTENRTGVGADSMGRRRLVVAFQWRKSGAARHSRRPHGRAPQPPSCLRSHYTQALVEIMEKIWKRNSRGNALDA